MKITFFVTIALLLITACSKSGSSTLTGRWKILNDSSIISGATTSYNVYNGNDNDYFDFASNGLLHTKENATDATYSYTLTSNDIINLTPSGANVNSVPLTGTYVIAGNQATIVMAPKFINPGFSYKESLTLRDDYLML